MDATFDITLEHIAGDQRRHIFRLAFHSSTDRLLLPYPDETGLQFANATAESIGEWQTRLLVSCPLDEFVLNSDSRIAFDIQAHINVAPAADHNPRWAIQLPAGSMNARFVFTVNPDIERYDFLAKRSRFAAITKPWGGSVESNVVQFTVPLVETSREEAT